jgi:hypothetical protein
VRLSWPAHGSTKLYVSVNATTPLSLVVGRPSLAEVDEQREAITSELAALAERASVAQRMRAACDSLAASYHPVHADWPEDPDAIHPGEYLTMVARPEEIRRVYRRYGARFEVDKYGVLTLRLTLTTSGQPLHLESSS